MKRNLNQALTDLNGKAIEEKAGDVTRPLTLATVCVNALLMPHEDERNLSGKDKVSRYELAKKINGAEGEIDVKAEDITLLKNLLAKAYTPLIVGQAYAVLEAEG